VRYSRLIEARELSASMSNADVVFALLPQAAIVRLLLSHRVAQVPQTSAKRRGLHHDQQTRRRQSARQIARARRAEIGNDRSGRKEQGAGRGDSTLESGATAPGGGRAGTA